MKRTNERTNWTKQKGRTLQFSIWRACKRESVLLSMFYTHSRARTTIYVESGRYVRRLYGKWTIMCRLNVELWILSARCVRAFFFSFFYTFSFFLVDVFPSFSLTLFIFVCVCVCASSECVIWIRSCVQCARTCCAVDLQVLVVLLESCYFSFNRLAVAVARGARRRHWRWRDSNNSRCHCTHFSHHPQSFASLLCRRRSIRCKLWWCTRLYEAIHASKCITGERVHTTCSDFVPATRKMSCIQRTREKCEWEEKYIYRMRLLLMFFPKRFCR